jgi:hypothetical protein
VLCELIGRSQRLGEASCLHLQGHIPSSALKLVKACFSEMLVCTSQSTLLLNAKEHHHNLHRLEKLKSNPPSFLPTRKYGFIWVRTLAGPVHKKRSFY